MDTFEQVFKLNSYSNAKHYFTTFWHKHFCSCGYEHLYTNPTSVYCIWPSVDRATFTSAWDIWFLQSIRELYIKEDLLGAISMHPAIKWMWNLDFGTLQFYFWRHCSNGMVGLVYKIYQYQNDIQRAMSLHELKNFNIKSVSRSWHIILSLDKFIRTGSRNLEVYYALQVQKFTHALDISSSVRRFLQWCDDPATQGPK